MRRALAALAALAFACGAQAAPTRAKVVPEKVSERAYYVRGAAGPASAQNEGFNSNAGFVVTPAGVVVIDALGTPRLGEALVAAIRKVTKQPIRRVIVTHYHADHFYGLAAFRKAGAEIWAHRGALEYLDHGDGDRRLQQRSAEIPGLAGDMALERADRWLDGDERFELGGIAFEVTHVGPAHSPEDLVVSVPSEGVVFSGDIIFSGRLPFVGMADSRKWLAKIDALLAARPRVLVTGHGEAARDAQRDLSLTRDYLRFLRQAMGKAAEEMTPFDEAYAKTDWSRWRSLPAFDAANRVNAYGQYLVMERELLER